MSLIQKINAVGIDAQIQNLQSYLYTELTDVEGWTNYESYERAYKNKKNDSTIPEIYIGEYLEVLFNDKFSATSFFLTEDNETISDNLCSSKISLIYQVQLNKLFPSVPHRADEELREMLKMLLKKNPYGFDLVGVQVGIDNVYADLDVNIDYTDDMQNFHVVRFDLELNYNITNC